LDLSRRTILAGGIAAAPGAAVAARTPDPFSEQAIAYTLNQYIAFGTKASGGKGDKDCGAWLVRKLNAAGYKCERQVFEAPYFDILRADLSVPGAQAKVWPQPLVVSTAPGGITGPLRLDGDMRGAIALIDLPARRWSTSKDPEIVRRLQAAFASGALGAVLIPNGPTGRLVALNATADAPAFAKPIAVLAPSNAATFLDAARSGQKATLRISGHGGRRPAFNIIARRRRGGRGKLVVSTPRSGWFTCAGERGPGLVTWLALARWAANAPLATDLEFLCTSGHEYENLGGAHYLEQLAPKPADVRLWVHLGANVAARDWREEAGGLRPLDTADPFRTLMASPALIEPARRAFAGQPGLETPRVGSVEASAGELTNILRAGYAPAIGVFGAHRFHHTRGDDARCIVAPPTRQAALSFKSLIEQVLA
jgi:hypothetical protein